MQCPFEGFKDLRCLVEIDALGKLQIDRGDLKRLWLGLVLRRYQGDTQATVNGLLERLTGTPDLLSKEQGYIIIERERRSHIMMLSCLTS